VKYELAFYSPEDGIFSHLFTSLSRLPSIMTPNCVSQSAFLFAVSSFLSFFLSCCYLQYLFLSPCLPSFPRSLCVGCHLVMLLRQWGIKNCQWYAIRDVNAVIGVPVQVRKEYEGGASPISITYCLKRFSCFLFIACAFRWTMCQIRQGNRHFGGKASLWLASDHFITNISPRADRHAIN
jgi:hypothetical protein